MDELYFNTTYEVEGPGEGKLIEYVATKIHAELRGNSDYINNHIIVSFGAGYFNVTVFWNTVTQPVPEWLRSQNNFNVFVSNLMAEVDGGSED